MKIYLTVILALISYGVSAQDCFSEVLVTCPEATVEFLIDRDEQCNYQYEIQYPDIEIIFGEVSIQSLINDIDPVSVNTTHLELPVGEHLLRHVVVDTCGNRTECEQLVKVYYNEPDFECPKDFIFLLDNSGSIGIVNFPILAEQIKLEIDLIGQKYSNARFAILHYGGACGDSIWIENDFTSHTNIAVPLKKLTFGDDLNEVLEQLIVLLNQETSDLVLSPIQSISPRTDAELNVVLVTNALANETEIDGCSDTALLPYTNLNILKAPPYNALFTVVHYGTPLADRESAAISSSGGKWQKEVANNPEDPENQILPRRYIPAPFYDYRLNILHTIPSCLDCLDCSDITATLSPIDSCVYSLNYINSFANNLDYIHLYTDTTTSFINAQVNLNMGFAYHPDFTQDESNLYIQHQAKIPKGSWSDILSFQAISSSTDPQIFISFEREASAIISAESCLDSISINCMEPFNTSSCLNARDISLVCNDNDLNIHDLRFRFINTIGETLDSIALSITEPSEVSFSNGRRDTVILFDPPLVVDFASEFIHLGILLSEILIDSIPIAIDLEYQTALQICRSEDFLQEYLTPCCEICENSFISFSDLDDLCCTQISLVDGCSYTNFERLELSLDSLVNWKIARPIDNQSTISNIDASFFGY